MAFAALLVTLLLLSGCARETPPAETSESQPQAARILFFYPGQASVSPGDQAQVCYGVEHATSVRLEPALAEIRPLSNKCVWVEPNKTMDLSLIARGEDGTEVSESLTLTVKAGSPSTSHVAPEPTSKRLIETLAATATSISPGGGSTICYVLSEKAVVTMEPSSGDLGTDLKKCVLVRPNRTTTYTLTANAGGTSDKASVTIRVE